MPIYQPIPVQKQPENRTSIDMEQKQGQYRKKPDRQLDKYRKG